MKFYGNKKTGKLLKGHMAHGVGKEIQLLGYEDILGKNNYQGQSYYIIRRKTEHGYVFKKTTSKVKLKFYLQIGWELVKDKGTNQVPDDYFQQEVIIDNL
ncbi:hypothetical protein [Anoxybacillus gonensis]|uniref:hypothetical protein n=1 Tax=Anoxybacillus gonensis TaxID=198467 RepID=UPI0002BFB328|nr:hypothetical protein [Anoxybacillus gonensis]EMI11398.1 hypothetical protein F510_0575 [Anoxybacillus gonensis]